MELFRIVLALLLAGFANARPQIIDTETILQQEATNETYSNNNNKEWKKPMKPSMEMTTENVHRGDSRYTENSGSRRKSYINYYRYINDSSPIKSRNSSGSSISSTSSNSSKTSSSNIIRKVSSGSVDSVRGSFDRFKLLNEEDYFRPINISDRYPYRPVKLSNHSKNDRSIYASRRLNLSKIYKLINHENDVLTKLDDKHDSKLNDNSQREVINNSGKRRLGANELALNQNLNSEERVDILDRKNIPASTYRNSVKVGHYGSTPVLSYNRFPQVVAIRNVTNTMLRDRENYGFSKHTVNDLNQSTKNSKLSTSVRKITPQSKITTNSRKPTINFVRRDNNIIDRRNITRVSQLNNQISKANSLLKNWPNDIPKDAEDFYNYHRYTSFPGQIQNLQNTDQLINPNNNNNSNVHHRVPAMQPGIQEIVQWMKVPAFSSNQSQMLESDEFDGPISVTFKPIYENLEPNLPLKPSVDNTLNHNNGNNYFDNLLHVSPNWDTSTTNNDLIQASSLPPKKTGYKPITQITQNTVVHILNNGSKKSNSTLTEINDLQKNISMPVTSIQASSITSDSQPNMQVMFLSEEDKVKENVNFDENCPTIMINSFTNVNNTIESKEGCTDLNIIINSHILNTNVIKPAETTIDDPNNADLSPNENNKYVGPIEDTYPSFSINNYETTPTAIYNTPSYHHDYIPQNDEIFQSEISSEPNYISSDLPILQVVQNTQVSVTNLNDQPNDVDGSTLSETPVENLDDTSGPVNNDVASTINQGQSASSTFTDVSGNGQGNSNANGLGTLQNSELSNRPNLPNTVSHLINNRPSSGTNLGSTVNNDDDDDDDDDDFDLSPSGVLESITSTFTYLTFFTPLNYSLFSLAAAPFAALAAGILGIAAFIFPWTIPSAFDFGRSSNPVTIKFTPNLDEVVRHSLQKYKRLNEWKRDFHFSVQLNETQRQLKDLQHINQSLRTVATQLLNVTNPNEGIKDTKLDMKDSKLNEKNEALFVKEINTEISNLESMGINFGRPINSKFGYFENSHPGQAMVMTEEELEKEMGSTRLMIAHKNHPTTTGGISTWILLNPPSTTMKGLTDNADQPSTTKQPENDVRYTLKPIVTHGRIEVKNTKNEQKTTSQLPSTGSIEKVIFPSTTKKATNNSTLKKTTLSNSSSSKQDETTQSLAKLEETIENTTSKISRTTLAASNTENKVTSASLSSTATTKKIQIIRSTLKAKSTTPRSTVVNKSGTSQPTKRPQQGKPKPSHTRRTTVKPDISKNDNSTTAKVEKVTFKAVPMITTPKPKNNITEKPMFVTKIKASVLMDTQKTTTTTTAPNVYISTTSNLNFSDVDLVELPVKSKPLGASINNALKVQLKKPIDDSTQIEIEPIKMNAPILTIQKVEKKPNDDMSDINFVNLNGTSIDLKFDFNPELTKISTEMENSENSMTTSSPSTMTTKRQRNSNKRKKNKIRRRRPSSSTPLTSTSTSTTTTPSTIVPVTAEEIIEISAEPNPLDNAIQESKIEPESKITNTNTKTKKKPPQKGISSQIYSFLSREVMPSFGVMSLLGLGLGLASYFLYPFGGTITRRNYEVEPNYKYNLDEYGGNYGQNEEDVLSKVLQGMTNHENKFGLASSNGVKDLDKNYYRYQHFDGAYDTQSVRRTDQRYPLPSSSPIYKPTEHTASMLKYRNTDYKYSEIQTTPTYYDPQKHNEFVISQDNSGNRQFVVGNIPKEYPPFNNDKHPTLSTTNKKGPNVFQEPTESGLTQFERDIAQGLNFPPNSINGHGYQSETQTLRPEDGYEEIEITPTAVAVEHGPRSLKIKRSISNRLSRSKRESVIQIIPSKHELEEEQKEEDLSNEILDIIDLALPGSDEKKIKHNDPDDFHSYKKKLHEESQKHHKEIGSRSPTLPNDTENNTNNVIHDSVEKITTEKQLDKIEEENYSSTSSFVTPISSSNESSDTTEHTKDIEETTIEWSENSTTTKPNEEGFNIFSFVKKVAEIKFRLGLTILKHASEGFARYLGHVQKRINGEE
ncbi:PREDICTED: uncharacterized protein LOC107068868 [Polistes dominula]|uniref:Uncharacterized protein LOC107068868 n=1 Tax=Polistes dominula TaxID=743375 RepID=A0ABM1ILU0_POLDO|nr:PREDICTED: uncharacterized protein LOC107068868 [Polistes dominula]